MKFLACALCICIWCLDVVCGASTFDGIWTAEVVRGAPVGNQVLTMTLITNDGKITGSLRVEGAKEVPIEWGMVKDDLIAFKVKQEPTPGGALGGRGPVTFFYLGRLEGDHIAFGRRPEDLTLGRLVTLTATRSKAR